jgi:Stress responsive A/B Barrel Domain
MIEFHSVSLPNLNQASVVIRLKSSIYSLLIFNNLFSMKNIFFSLLAFLSLSVATAQKPNKNSKKLLRHVVIFKYKESSSPEDIKKVTEAFVGLKKQISVVKDFEWGVNKSPEHFDQGFTHCYVLTFANEKDRDEIYQKHPAHKAFQEVLKPHMDKVFVVDYWVE